MSVHSELKVNKVIHGIDCPSCGGELVPSKIKTITGKIINAVSMGIIRIHNYRCKNCCEKFNLF